MSLKPYLKESRRDKLDQCIKLANISSVISDIKPANVIVCLGQALYL